MTGKIFTFNGSILSIAEAFSSAPKTHSISLVVGRAYGPQYHEPVGALLIHQRPRCKARGGDMRLGPPEYVLTGDQVRVVNGELEVIRQQPSDRAA